VSGLRPAAEDLRRFQLHQTHSGLQPPSVNSAGLRFFFAVTLDRPDFARWLTVVRRPRRLPAALSLTRSGFCSRRRGDRSTRQPSPARTAPGCASPRWSRSSSATSTSSACSCRSAAEARLREGGGRRGLARRRLGTATSVDTPRYPAILASKLPLIVRTRTGLGSPNSLAGVKILLMTFPGYFPVSGINRVFW
jgi:hypothetical protein